VFEVKLLVSILAKFFSTFFKTNAPPLPLLLFSTKALLLIVKLLSSSAYIAPALE
jgi:hypothetical protein